MAPIYQDAAELLNVYDASGRVTGVRMRHEAKGSGEAVGAVNVLLVNRRGEVLLQQRPVDKENGGLWDKSVGGHVSAGEDFDDTAVRETGEELFDDGATSRVALARDEDDLRSRTGGRDLRGEVLLCRVGLQLNLRDVRHVPGGGLRNVLYHVAMYLGRTDVPRAGFRPQSEEIVDLRYMAPGEVDRLLVEGRLAPNMALLWLSLAWRALSLAGA
jgi:hypothetical protein